MSAHKEEKPMDAYAKSGVDISAQDRALEKIKTLIKGTLTTPLAAPVGSFGSCFHVSMEGMQDPVFIASCDGVGTKIKVAIDADKLAGVGEDIVNHCIDDVLVQGATRPLFFLDYYAAGKLDPDRMVRVVEGMARACKANGMAFIGGETAEMPGFYHEGLFDLAGFIVAMAEKKNLLDGSAIRPGDILVGLPSSGLHTNGYSLARNILFEKVKMKLSDTLPGTDQSVADLLLSPHTSYLPILKKPIEKGWLRGLAHITGGGMTDNIPRVLPDTCDCDIQVGSWEIPPLFRFLQEKGKVNVAEMFHVFNMGVGMVAIVDGENASRFTGHLARKHHAFNIIGSVHEGKGSVIYNLRG